MTTRTVQDLLSDRRANCLEAHRSADAMTKAMCMAYVATIDAELDRRRIAEGRKPLGQVEP